MESLSWTLSFAWGLHVLAFFFWGAVWVNLTHYDGRRGRHCAILMLLSKLKQKMLSLKEVA